ncbi:hypothetical protein [Sphingomonas bacterium]|uniref:hypothetical protein n=1 Tax=Sphingomonas bacterium TaxID=1895847 RepID=UPI0015771BAA|nr:hypothetical protein [Sphingomonas bacterium]
MQQVIESSSDRVYAATLFDEGIYQFRSWEIVMRLAFAVLCFAAAASPLSAQSLRPFTVGVTGGTLGIGPEVTYDINPFLSVRGSATFFGVGASGSTASYRYRGHAHVSNFGGTIDFHPFVNGFRLSAGARSTEHNRVSFTGTARNNRTFSGVIYTPDQVGPLNGEVRAKSISPLVSVGYVRSTLIGLTFGFDAGVMFHGRPTAYNFSAPGQLGTNPAAASEYANQQQRVENEVDGLKYYPIAQLSVGYRF